MNLQKVAGQLMTLSSRLGRKLPLSNYPSVCPSSGLKGQSKGQPGVQLKGSGSQPIDPRASLRDLRVFERGLRTCLRRSQLGIKASRRGVGLWQGWTNEQTKFLPIPQGFAPNGAAI